MDEDRPRDVRDSLSELEQRLLELERELREDSASDAIVGRHTVPAPSPPRSATTGTIEVEREPEPAEAPPVRTGPARPERRFSGAPAAPPLMANPGPAAHWAGPDDVGPLVDETRRKFDDLRTSLDGLTGASDRLREVAQVVVEDHGRALVRLERATAERQARSAAAAEGPAAPLAARVPSITPPARRAEPEPAAEPAVTREKDLEPAGRRAEDARDEQLEPAARAPEEPEDRKLEPAGGRLEEPDDTRHEAREPAHVEDEDLEPGDVEDEDLEPGETQRRPHWLAAADGGRQRRKWAGIATLVVAGAAITALVLGNRDKSPTTTTPTVPGALSRIALTPELGPDTRAFSSVPGTRPASDAGAVDDLCDGVVGAAVIVRASGSDPVPPCPGIVTVASGSVSAMALAEHRSSSQRTCVEAGDVPSIAAARADRRLTAARDRTVQAATTKAERLNRNSNLTAGERAGRAHTAAYAAGRAFDSSRGLRLLAVRSSEQGTCVVPGRDDVASGRYPLASRVELLASRASLDQPAVDRAAAVIAHLTSGPAPINATVLTRSG